MYQWFDFKIRYILSCHLCDWCTVPNLCTNLNSYTIINESRNNTVQHLQCFFQLSKTNKQHHDLGTCSFYLPIFHFFLPVTSIKTCVELPPLQNRKTSSVSVSNGVVQAAELVPVLASAHQIKACLQSCLYSYKMLVESICHIMILLCKYHMILHNVWYTNIIYESLYVILCYYITLYSIIYVIILECIFCILKYQSLSDDQPPFTKPPLFQPSQKTAVFFSTRNLSASSAIRKLHRRSSKARRYSTWGVQCFVGWVWYMFPPQA